MTNAHEPGYGKALLVTNKPHLNLIHDSPYCRAVTALEGFTAQGKTKLAAVYLTCGACGRTLGDPSPDELDSSSFLRSKRQNASNIKRLSSFLKRVKNETLFREINQ